MPESVVGVAGAHKGRMCWGRCEDCLPLKQHPAWRYLVPQGPLFPIAEVSAPEKVCSLQDRGAHPLHRTAGEGECGGSTFPAPPLQVLSPLRVHVSARTYM